MVQTEEQQPTMSAMRDEDLSASHISNSSISSNNTMGTTVNGMTASSSSSLGSSGSSVSDFYNGKTVFITGGTGFMGKVLLEKLLRACPGVAKIYLLIRPKKGQDAHERLKVLLSSPLFDAVRKTRPADLHNKVLPIEGDITQPELAISSNDRLTLQRTVNIVFHSAATIKFDEKLKLSVTINVLGTQRLIGLCSRMTNLEAVVHVSTAYCNCDRSVVKEEIYPPPMAPSQVTALVDCLDEELLDQLTEKLVGNRPNTYTFTKALAECWLKENKGDLPLVIVRPSIVLCSYNEPLQGWLDNWNGPTGIIAAAGKGLFRTMLCDPNKVADLVPVDMVINLMLVSAWRIGTTKATKELPIYNCSTGVRKPITWSNFISLCFKYMRKHPFSEVTWYPDGMVTASRTRNNVNQILLQWLPAYLMDAVVWLAGGKPIMLRIQDKLSRAASCLEYFTMNEWRFDDNNVRQLSLLLNERDLQEFSFDVAKIDWEKYVEAYVLGIRRFLFKEDAATLPKARQQVSRLHWLYRCIQLVGVMCTWHFLALRYGPLRRLWSQFLQFFLVHIVRMLPSVRGGVAAVV